MEFVTNEVSQVIKMSATMNTWLKVNRKKIGDYVLWSIKRYYSGSFERGVCKKTFHVGSEEMSIETGKLARYKVLHTGRVFST